jgi:beta-phosphoglucomutase-like phosphatase (HAD superfamily)
MPDAVMFDLDGVLVDSEQLWNQAGAVEADRALQARRRLRRRRRRAHA